LLQPALTSPKNLPLEELNLAGNGLTDNDAADILAKVIVTHCECRDEIFWKYGLRNELPPHSSLRGLKKIDLSFNKLGERTVYQLGRTLAPDRYIAAVSLRSNMVENQHAVDLLYNLKDNHSLFNLDLRDNVDIKQKIYR
jgi:Leucine-rich repeat (LRR) protein